MGVDPALRKRVKENVYLVVVEGFQLLSEWTGRVWQQSAWKFSRPAKDSERFDAERVVEVTDYEKVLFTANCSVNLIIHLISINLTLRFTAIGGQMQLLDRRKEGTHGDYRIHQGRGHHDGTS